MVILQLAMSLDGFIAREDGSVDFLDDITGDVETMFQTFLSKIDTIVMGRTTYDQMLTFGPIPFADKDMIVLSSRELVDPPKHVKQMDISPQDLVQGRNETIWLFGGAHVIHQFLNQNLIDRFELFIVPQVIGKGIPLFDSQSSLSDLRLIETKEYEDNVLLVYENTSNR